MKYIVIILILLAFAYINGKMQKSAFDDCMKAGVQSEETCLYYSR